MSGTRALIVGRIAEHLVAEVPSGRAWRVGVDGITAAGKSTLAAELTAAVTALGRPARQLSTDDFHHPRARRHRQGRESARRLLRGRLRPHGGGRPGAASIGG